jgi:hypothetical protein
MVVLQKRFCRRNESIASLCGIGCSAFPSVGFSGKLDLHMTSLCFPVAIGPVRRQDGWRAAKGDGDFHAKEETLAYEPT